jgi:hypothetical protein
MFAVPTLCAALACYSNGGGDNDMILIGCAYGTSVVALGAIRAYTLYLLRPKLPQRSCGS